MKLNENTKIIHEKVILVPYEIIHVKKYHEWMEDDEIRRLTGSERLTLEDEYEMQKNWRNDSDKLTFIILSKEKVNKGLTEEDSMIGDVNLFINISESSAEVEVMIAEPSARGKGFACDAVSLLLSYAINSLGIKQYFVKITDDNKTSLHIFEKKLHFIRTSYSSAFGEYTLHLPEGKVELFSSYIDTAQVVNYKE